MEVQCPMRHPAACFLFLLAGLLFAPHVAVAVEPGPQPDGTFVVAPGRDLGLATNWPGVYGLIRGETYRQPRPIRLPSGVTLVAVGDPEKARPRIVAPRGFINHTHGSARDVTFRGLHITPGESRDADSSPTGVRIIGGVEGITFDDCLIEGFRDNLSFMHAEGRPVRNVTLRNCIVRNAWATGAHSQGLYANTVKGLTIEGNVFSHNGWNEQHPAPGHYKFNHELYINSGCRDVTVRGNVFADACADAVQIRPGGVMEGNLFVGCPIAGYVGGPEPGVVRDNLVLLSPDGPDDRPLGWGISIGSSSLPPSPSSTVEGNLLGLRTGNGGDRPAITVYPTAERVRLIDNAADHTWPSIHNGEPEQIIESRGNRVIELDADPVKAAARAAVADAVAGEIAAVEAIRQVRRAIGGTVVSE